MEKIIATFSLGKQKSGLFSNMQHAMKIQVWLKDAVELKAKIVRLDLPLTSPSQNEPGFKLVPGQVEARFEYNGENLVRSSKPGTLLTGFSMTFAKYHDKEITILYSPTHDEIMIPKQKI
ncbi:MAG: hypothetical protein FWE53_01200 [Firmicutes bacterium]|nr:hypothetical protein [Bacillota bacterium]